VGFVQERERVIRQQQEAILQLSTPVLQVRERLLILPIIGVIDPQRARQLTEQLLRGIRTNRAKVVGNFRGKTCDDDCGTEKA
jgi:rsbT co-antagonist protein RsbR